MEERFDHDKKAGKEDKEKKNFQSLILNPGSTSTKIAVFTNENPGFVHCIDHSDEEISSFPDINSQYDFRKEAILRCLLNENISGSDIDFIVSRGGLLPPIQSGAYRVNEKMVTCLRERPLNNHASNLGPMIAMELSDQWNIPAYIYDGVTVDELTDINRLTGLPSLHRKGMGHNLNTRAVARQYAEDQGKSYQDVTVIVAHLGGGITVNLHQKGRIVDLISDEEGPYSPERSGGLPMFDIIRLCCTSGISYQEMMKQVKSEAGLYAYLGTKNAKEVEERIVRGDKDAKLVYDGMLLNIAKNIGKIAVGTRGQIDAIILTGGIAFSEYAVQGISSYVSFLAPVVTYPGEFEMEALALGGLRVARGEEEAKEFLW